MSMGDAVALLDYWREYPPAHLILRAVHMGEARAARPARQSDTPAARSRGAEADESEFMQQLFKAQMMAGAALGPRREMPERLKQMADYAEETISKMGLN